jgi:hypothetical protein
MYPPNPATANVCSFDRSDSLWALRLALVIEFAFIYVWRTLRNFLAH